MADGSRGGPDGREPGDEHSDPEAAAMEAASEVLGPACKAAAAAAGCIVLTPDGNRVLLATARGHDPAFISHVRQLRLATTHPFTEAALLGQPIWVRSADEWRRRYPAAPHGFRAAAAVPMTVNRRPVGVLGLSFDQDMDFPPDARSFLLTLGQLCAGAIEHRRLREAERRHHALLEALFCAAPVGLVLLDNDMRYLNVNDALAAMNGLPARDHKGKRPSDVLGAPGEALEELLKETLASGKPIEGLDITATVATGAHVHLRLDVFPARVDEEVVGVGAVVTDVTASRTAEKALQQANEDLRRLNLERARLMQTVAHELKNPLTAIGMQLDLLPFATTAEKQAAAVAALRRNLARLVALADDVSGIGRTAGGQLKLDLKPTSLRWMVEEAVLRHEPSAQMSGIELRLECQDEAQVIADAARIAQVLDNLLSNAIKFTPSGGEVVLRASASLTHATVEVADSGPGLTSEQKARLFTPFARLHPEARKTGTGLGLYIAHTIVDQHGGAMWANSEGPGQGSVFGFDLPLTGAKVGQGPPPS